MIYPEHFEEKIGFDRIRNMIKARCISNLGREKVETMAFSAAFDLVHAQLQQTTEMQHICLYEDQFPVNHYYDVKPYINKVKIEGTFLSAKELFDLKRSLDTIKSVVRFFQNAEDDAYPFLKELVKDIVQYPFISEKINKILNKYGEIRDNASPELLRIRQTMASRRANISKITNQIMRQAQQQGLVEKDVSVTVRDGKMLIPLPASNKRKIKGVVYDESATGKTAYIEPMEVIEANNEIRELEFAEKREILRILVEIADEIRPYCDELLYAYDSLAEIDFIRAKALFSIEIKGIMPKLQSNAMLDFRQAKHPLLDLAFRRENKKVVPLDIELNPQQRIVLISGPNAGGKSVCLKTVGLLQYMLQCGLPIPVSEYSSAGIFRHLFINIGDEQSIENDLSTYSSHLVSMKFFVERANQYSLILIDELGTGTEPMLGAAIAESILEELNHLKTFGVVTTHYSNLKHYANTAEGVVNGAMQFDTKQMQPLFKLVTGKPGSSFAFEIAGKIGLPKRLLKTASEKVGKEHVDFERNLQKIEEDKLELEHQKRKLQQIEKQLENKIKQYDREVDFTLKQRKNILAISQEQARDILNSANKQIEHTIKEIREANAEKETTKKLRAELDTFKEKEIEKQAEEEKRIEAKIKKIQEREAKRQREKAEETKQPEDKKITPQKSPPKVVKNEIETGDFVKLKKQNTVGEVLEINGNTLTITFGQMHSKVKRKNVEPASIEEAEKARKNKPPQKKTEGLKTSDVADNFVPGLDLRGKRADEALNRLIEHIDQAIVAQASELRILHGTGNGILRKVLRDYLRTVNVVERYHDERIENGGAGITVVHLNFD